jgi:hypothetical protein
VFPLLQKIEVIIYIEAISSYYLHKQSLLRGGRGLARGESSWGNELLTAGCESASPSVVAGFNTDSVV